MLHTVHHIGKCYAAAIEDRGHDVRAMVILVTHFAARLDSLRPVNHERIGGPAIIEEPTTTIVLPPGSVAHVRDGHYLVEVGSG